MKSVQIYAEAGHIQCILLLMWMHSTRLGTLPKLWTTIRSCNVNDFLYCRSGVLHAWLPPDERQNAMEYTTFWKKEHV